MTKKIVKLDLKCDIQDLIIFQEFMNKELSPDLPEGMFDIMNDILTVLKSVRQIQQIEVVNNNLN